MYMDTFICVGDTVSLCMSRGTPELRVRQPLTVALF